MRHAFEPSWQNAVHCGFVIGHRDGNPIPCWQDEDAAIHAPDEGRVMREPAWLTHMVDQRIAFMKHVLGKATAGFANYDVVMVPLTEPAPGSTEADLDRFERTCDNCGSYVEKGPLFGCGMVQRQVDGHRVLITYGVCSSCPGGEHLA